MFWLEETLILMTNMLKKVFNWWSEVHLSEMTCYKIHTLTIFKNKNKCWKSKLSLNLVRATCNQFFNDTKVSLWTHSFLGKGGSISESDLSPFSGDLSQSEKLFEIKPPLESLIKILYPHTWNSITSIAIITGLLATNTQSANQDHASKTPSASLQQTHVSLPYY